MERREVFTSTVTEKLFTYALGRGVEFYDWPAIRRDHTGCGGKRRSLVRGYPGDCEERAVSDANEQALTAIALERRRPTDRRNRRGGESLDQGYHQ